MAKKVLIVCTGNSCRSQMAEGLWRELGGSNWIVKSAGSQPAGYVHPLAIEAMANRGLDISKARSKSLSELGEDRYDLLVTVCDNAKESCPVLSCALTYLHWPFDDPNDAAGSDELKLTEFERVRDEIERKIESYLNSPPG